jgi:hypothetical protein
MRRVCAAAPVTGVTALAVALLTACSVPREADLATSVPSTSAPAPSATAPSTTAPPPTPTPTPTAVKPPVPKRVAGYTLKAGPRGLGDPLAAVRGAGDLFAEVSVRSVARGDTPVGLLLLFAVRPQYVDQPRVASLVLPKVVDGVTGGGLPVAMQRFGKQRVAVGSSPKKGTIVLWYDAGVLAVVVGGGTPSTVTDYAKAYVTRR